jgi:hypothetical protein
VATLARLIAHAAMPELPVEVPTMRDPAPNPQPSSRDDAVPRVWPALRPGGTAARLLGGLPPGRLPPASPGHRAAVGRAGHGAVAP